MAPTAAHDLICRVTGVEPCGLQSADTACEIFTLDSDLAAWAPDGTAVYYSALVDTKRRIVGIRLTAPATADVVAPDLPNDARFPTVSPDGHRLAFLSRPADVTNQGRLQVYVANLDTKTVEQKSNVPVGWSSKTPALGAPTHFWIGLAADRSLRSADSLASQWSTGICTKRLRPEYIVGDIHGTERRALTSTVTAP